jgi:hypothetical protein
MFIKVIMAPRMPRLIHSLPAAEEDARVENIAAENIERVRNVEEVERLNVEEEDVESQSITVENIVKALVKECVEKLRVGLICIK